MFIQTVQRFLLRAQVLNPICQRGLRNGTSYRDEKVVSNEDGSIVVCWHPEPKFPYELTQAVPREIPTETTMKVQAVDDMKQLYHFKHERFARRDLMRLTWTAKHRWFLKAPGRKEAKMAVRAKRERPYL